MSNLNTILRKEIGNLYDRLMNDECELDEEQQEMLLVALMHKAMSKEQIATEVLHWSRSKFDDYVARGLMPAGRKRRGWKELAWYKDEVLRAAEKLKNNY